MAKVSARAYSGLGGGKAKPFTFRTTAGIEILPVLEADELKQREKDRKWVESIEKAIGTESAAQLVEAIRELNPADAHTLLRGASLEPIDGPGFLPALSRERAARHSLPPAAPEQIRQLPTPAAVAADGGQDEADFWLALDGYREGTTTAIEVDRTLSRPSLRRRDDLRANFDRTRNLKGTENV